MKRYIPLYIIAIAALFLVGCSDDTITPDTDVAGQQGVFGGEIGDADFEIVLETAIGPDFPLQGPFVLSGRNLRYDDTLGALLVDLTIRNAGTVSHPLPVGMTFMDLLPANVAVLNPDNGEHGPGAAIEFEFANDDLAWTPGEVSFPRTVQFQVSEGTAIGFTARIDIGMHPDGGTIGGVVWVDRDRDGEMDGDEPGLEGAVVILETSAPGDSLMMMGPDYRWETRTGPDGSYRFDGLSAGHYVVGKGFHPPAEPTTPSPIHVILVNDGDGVSDFLMANFGCIPRDPPPPPPPGDSIKVGDLVMAFGHYSDFVGVVFANSVDVKTSCDTTVTDTTGTEPPRPRTEIIPDACDEAFLCGPMTGSDLDNDILVVMGSMYTLDLGPGSIDPAELQFRERVWARVVTLGPNDRVITELQRCDDKRDTVIGVVEELLNTPGGRFFGFRAAGIRVYIADIVAPPEEAR